MMCLHTNNNYLSLHSMELLKPSIAWNLISPAINRRLHTPLRWFDDSKVDTEENAVCTCDV